MNLIKEISSYYDGRYLESNQIKKNFPIGSTISNPHTVTIERNECKIRLLGVYETGMKLPPTHSDTSVYKLIIESDNITEKLSLYPKNNLIYFFEKLITNSSSRYRKTKSNLFLRLFKRIDFLNYLKNIDISIYTQEGNETGKKIIIINPFKKYLNLQELKSLLEIGIILTEEIKPAHNNG
jgi:hypothetical protein